MSSALSFSLLRHQPDLASELHASARLAIMLQQSTTDAKASLECLLRSAANGQPNVKGLINLLLTLISAVPLSELPRKAMSLLAGFAVLLINTVQRLRERRTFGYEGETLAFEDMSGTRHEVRASPSAQRSCKHKRLFRTPRSITYSTLIRLLSLSLSLTRCRYTSWATRASARRASSRR